MKTEKTDKNKKAIFKGMPTPVADYSPIILIKGNEAVLSGQIGTNPKTKKLRKGIKAQTKQALNNLLTGLKEAGFAKEDFTEIHVLITDKNHLKTVNEVYGEWLKKIEIKPTRTMAGVLFLPGEALIEIYARARR